MIWDFPYDSPNAIIALLESHGFAMSKKFGQNFLISSSARQKITDCLQPLPGRRVWEIGPGIGALTTLLLQNEAQVTAFEIDHGFCRILREEAFPDEDKLVLIEGDALKTWHSVYEQEGVPDLIFGNLPYNIGSICIARFLESQCLPQRMVFTLQKEVGERLGAGPGSKAWSTLSILAQIDYQIEQVSLIKGSAFFPPPNVDSVVIRMEKRPQPLVKVAIRELFLQLMDDLFTQRRKTVRNNLLHGKAGSRHGKELVLQALADADIPESERAEKLGFEELLRLVEAFAIL
ncbi:MAG: ribosomal RNA small subunit methyltransferase A [Spirochaetae bacterium HGW-Spirochaetae-8]|nr:MAG: ribosomal RNA small subunit methyltransferase A [Spirochaetae bacterium HGW-Spirochaetae-8]